MFRNTRANGNPLPAFFANLAGVSQQGVRATATAQVLFGRAATNCILPFAIPDRWFEMREDIATTPPLPQGNALDDPALSFIPLREDSREDLLYHPYDTTWFTQWDPNDTYDAYVQVGQHGGAPLTPPVDLFPVGLPPALGRGGLVMESGVRPADDNRLQLGRGPWPAADAQERERHPDRPELLLPDLAE